MFFYAVQQQYSPPSCTLYNRTSFSFYFFISTSHVCRTTQHNVVVLGLIFSANPTPVCVWLTFRYGQIQDAKSIDWGQPLCSRAGAVPFASTDRPCLFISTGGHGRYVSRWWTGALSSSPWPMETRSKCPDWFAQGPTAFAVIKVFVVLSSVVGIFDSEMNNQFLLPEIL